MRQPATPALKGPSALLRTLHTGESLLLQAPSDSTFPHSTGTINNHTGQPAPAGTTQTALQRDHYFTHAIRQIHQINQCASG